MPVYLNDSYHSALVSSGMTMAAAGRPVKPCLICWIHLAAVSSDASQRPVLQRCLRHGLLKHLALGCCMVV